MDGTAVKYPVMVIWLAYAQGLTLSPSQQVLLAILSVMTSVGSAPIPTVGLALWVMVLNAVNVPVNGLLGLLFGMEWLVDRLETMVNVTSDSICAGIMTHIIDLGQLDIGDKYLEFDPKLSNGVPRQSSLSVSSSGQPLNDLERTS